VYVTGDGFLVEGDVGAMLTALTRHERDFELRRTERHDVVGYVLA